MNLRVRITAADDILIFCCLKNREKTFISEMFGSVTIELTERNDELEHVFQHENKISIMLVVYIEMLVHWLF